MKGRSISVAFNKIVIADSNQTFSLHMSSHSLGKWKLHASQYNKFRPHTSRSTAGKCNHMKITVNINGNRLCIIQALPSYPSAIQLFPFNNINMMR